jgi:hypothetical protein
VENGLKLNEKAVKFGNTVIYGGIHYPEYGFSIDLSPFE